MGNAVSKRLHGFENYLPECHQHVIFLKLLIYLKQVILLKKFQIIFSEAKYHFADLEDCFCIFPSVVVKILKLVFE